MGLWSQGAGARKGSPSSGEPRAFQQQGGKEGDLARGLSLRPACHCAGLRGAQATVGAQLEPVVLSQHRLEPWWARSPRGCEGGCASAAGRALDGCLPRQAWS